MNCEYCGKDEPLPFVCNYCGGLFCSDHRLPEAHQCKGDLRQKRTIVPPPTTTFTWSDTPYTPPAPQPGAAFSAIEVRDIVVAWLGLALAFSISIQGGYSALAGVSAHTATEVQTFVVALVTIGSGFVLHELSHKFTARRYGHWAEFRMWPLGLVLALLTSLIGFIFAAPGATYISGQNISEAENGKISLAGPVTNVIVASFFFGILLVGLAIAQNFLQYMGLLGTYFNLFLAIFNLLPLGPLDGAKVFRWSKVLWVCVFVPLVIVFVYLFFY